MTAMQAALAAVKEKQKLQAAAAAGAASKKDVVEDTSLKKKGKVKKSVRWKPDEELEAIRWIEKAIYDGDAMNALNLGEGEVSVLPSIRMRKAKLTKNFFGKIGSGGEL